MGVSIKSKQLLINKKLLSSPLCFWEYITFFLSCWEESLSCWYGCVSQKNKKETLFRTWNFCLCSGPAKCWCWKYSSIQLLISDVEFELGLEFGPIHPKKSWETWGRGYCFNNWMAPKLSRGHNVLLFYSSWREIKNQNILFKSMWWALQLRGKSAGPRSQANCQSKKSQQNEILQLAKPNKRFDVVLKFSTKKVNCQITIVSLFSHFLTFMSF